MPNLNLKADTPAPTPGMKTSGKSRGYGTRGKKIAGLPASVVFILVAVILLGGGYFALNRAGIIGKKKVAAVVVAPPPAVVEDTAKTATAVSESERLAEFKEKPASGAEKKSVATSVLPEIPMSSNGRYSVQVSSWSSGQKAKIEADAMTRAGFPAFVEKAEVKDGEKRFRVCVGRYDSDKDARNSAEKIAHMLEGEYWVVRLNK